MKATLCATAMLFAAPLPGIGAGEADAAVITFTQAFDMDATADASNGGIAGDSTIFTFPKFDPLVGTLTAVSFTTASTYLASGSIHVTDGPAGGGPLGPGAFGDNEVRGQQAAGGGLVGDFGPFDFLLFHFLGGPALSIVCDDPGPTCDATDTFADGINETDDIFAGDVPQFVGTDDVTVSIGFDIFRDIFACQGTCTGDGRFQWSGTMTLAYTFFAAPPVPVPEPMTAALLGVGLIALGVARRQN